MPQVNNTAILFFSRNLKEEFLAKNVGLNIHQFSNLFNLLVQKTRRTIDQTKIPVKPLFSNEQIGSSFGERLTNGISNLFSEGFDNVIVVGNDAPELSSEDLLWVEKRLKSGKNVLGRDSHGGAYLIGVSKKDFCADEFLKVSWNTSFVFDQLNTLLSSEELDNRLIDLNKRSDFESIIKRGLQLSKAFKQILKAIFGTYTIRTNFNFTLPKSIWFQHTEVRGPPSLVF
ncbi:DUF2064 domain-containing protein [Roseivirga echinicomitans]|uniref:DUF2064 domain-containing protein n=1 Tax=Roseivirga echinicomitans TaxID=296218 RepID=A0A150XNT9_9BACT|nr:DUF2064 domain-containing protein [Roseivirga echinicomitans]KYG80252.1 hypothetical protein AWN68_17285 [Roseivirga echinicomitans]